MAARKKGDRSGRPNAAELRAMSESELAEKLAEQRTILMNARFQHATAQLENTAELPAMRRQVARMETILNEKKKKA